MSKSRDYGTHGVTLTHEPPPTGDIGNNPGPRFAHRAPIFDMTNSMTAAPNIVIHRTIPQMQRRRDQIGTETGKSRHHDGPGIPSFGGLFRDMCLNSMRKICVT